MKAKKNPRFIIYTNIDGSRGVDFDMQLQAFVIMAFLPKNRTIVFQALGRGCKNPNQQTQGCIITEEETLFKGTEDF